MKRKILSLLLAVAMLLSLMAGLSGCGSGDQPKTPGTQKAETFTVEDGQTALASEDGAAIDFGCLLEAGEELTIQKVSPASIDSDVEIYAEHGASWQEDVISAFLNANNSLPMFAETNISTLVSLGGAYDDTITEPFGNALTEHRSAPQCETTTIKSGP